MPVNFNNDNNINRSEIMSQKREQFKLLNKDITLFEPQYVSQDENDDSISNSLGARFDGVIGVTMQSYKTGDCWLLAGVNSLNQTDWGREIIKNSLKPDAHGGVVVTLNGAKCSQKDFHITAEDLKNAQQNEKYSVGDNDMTAIELAVEKYAQLQVKEGKLDKSADKLISGGIDISVYELFTGKSPHLYIMPDSRLTDCFDKIEKNPGEYAIYCSFLKDEDSMYKDHAYTLKSIEKNENGSKNAVLLNPWDSSKTYTVPFEDFKNNLQVMLIGENPACPEENLKSGYDEQKLITEARLLSSQIKTSIISDDEKALKESLKRINKDNILYLLNFYPSVITMLDSYKSGWGNGNAKKSLIMPIINTLIEKAESKKLDASVIQNFKNVCINQELDAFLYTDAEKINSEVKKLKHLIEEK